jgi:ceramide glucosyltransferase
MMPQSLATAIEILTTVMAVAGMGYFVAAIVAARVCLHERRATLAAFAPSVSILKSLKGVDPGMIEAFRSHCRQAYRGEYELLFGISSFDEPAAEVVTELKLEFPDLPIRLIECRERLGANGKVSTLAQLLPHARYEFILINDSDITVSERYLERVMARFAPPLPPLRPSRDESQPPVGLVTALYRGRSHGTLPSRLESLGISTDFMAGVLLSKIGGLEPLADYLADDYELGARIAAAGYRVALSAEVVQTAIPAYRWRGFVDHQLRWLRAVRDARPAGYAGLIVTHGLGWALLNTLASGLRPLSLWLLAMSFFLRLTMAMTVGAIVLGDHQVLDGLWLLPLRDVIAMGLWVSGFAGNTIVWRGERFELKDGKLRKLEGAG